MNNLPWQSKLPYDVGEKHLSYLPCTKSRLTNYARNELHKLGQMVYASEDCVMSRGSENKGSNEVHALGFESGVRNGERLQLTSQ